LKRYTKNQLRTTYFQKINNSGFTLIEVIIAISIIVLLIGGFALVVGGVYTETEIRKPSGKLEILSQRVRTIATVHQRTYQIYLTEKGLYILPFGENPQDHPPTSWNYLKEQDSQREPPLRYETTREFHAIEDTVDFFIKGWGMKEFKKLEDNFSYAWQFEPSGMIEPISIRFEIPHADQTSWLEQTYHPLTATVSTETMEIYD